MDDIPRTKGRGEGDLDLMKRSRALVLETQPVVLYQNSEAEGGPIPRAWEEGREGGSSEMGSDEMRCELGSYEFK